MCVWVKMFLEQRVQLIYIEHYRFPETTSFPFHDFASSTSISKKMWLSHSILLYTANVVNFLFSSRFSHDDSWWPFARFRKLTFPLCVPLLKLAADYRRIIRARNVTMVDRTLLFRNLLCCFIVVYYAEVVKRNQKGRFVCSCKHSLQFQDELLMECKT